MRVTAAVNVWVFGFASYNPYRFLMAQPDSVASNVGSQRLGHGRSTNGTPCPIVNSGGWHRFLHAETYGTRRSRVDVFLPRARDRKTCPFKFLNPWHSRIPFYLLQINIGGDGYIEK